MKNWNFTYHIALTADRKRRMRPPSARVPRSNIYIDRSEKYKQLKREHSAANEASSINHNDNYFGKSVVTSKKTAFGSISHKRMAPMSISTMHGSNQDLNLDKADHYNSVENDPGNEYNERYHDMQIPEPMSAHEKPITAYTKFRSNRRPQAPLETKPVTQTAAVKPVKIFGSYSASQDTLPSNNVEPCLTDHLQFNKQKEPNFLGSFQKMDKSRVEQITTGVHSAPYQGMSMSKFFFLIIINS